MLATVTLLAILYNGLLYPEMAGVAAALQKAHPHAKIEVLWHDAEASQTSCPEYLSGHSMGGNAALRQATRCALAGRKPRAVVTIDPGRAPLYHTCPRGVRCINYYNPANPIGGQAVSGAQNIIIPEAHLAIPNDPRVIRGALAAMR